MSEKLLFYLSVTDLSCLFANGVHSILIGLALFPFHLKPAFRTFTLSPRYHFGYNNSNNNSFVGEFMELDGWFILFILFWTVVLIGSFAIGGFFMFRKFLKRMPKEDGKSVLDWEEHYVNETRHLWKQPEKDLLEDLVSPVPELFRDVARQKIAGKIGELAVEEKRPSITEELVIRGYILATPKRDHKFLRKKLAENKIDIAPYKHLF